ncbi:exodeoxyribonuclease VII large subunit, partial [bacterium]|nr:exodeoxyribonuclease VII large subunit [bacterium]
QLLEGVWVEGEVSNLVKAASGHIYLTLKDEKATLKAALWAGNRRKIQVDLSNGSKVFAFGSISIYEPRGEYQLLITDLKPAGLGSLYEVFEKLKKKLLTEGLFDPARKIPLPFLPKGVGIVTSPKGSVIQDIYRVIRRRFPNIPLFLVPAKVQGEGACQEIVAGISRLDCDPRVDVIIVARGGGSIEDLWAFNEEMVARAIYAAKKPIVSAIGHETDTTIADFVADTRAATPSVAGELVVPVKEDLKKAIGEKLSRLNRALKNRLGFLSQKFSKAMDCRFLRKPGLWVVERRNTIANKSRDLDVSFKSFFQRVRRKHEILHARITSLNPKAILKRGFTMVTKFDGSVISSVSQLQIGSIVNLHLSDGRSKSKIEAIEPS